MDELDLAVERRVAEGIPGLSRVQDAALEPLRRGVDVALRPWDHVIKPLRGGRYRYEGKGFAAIIRNDGSVEMRDHSGVYLALTPIREASNGPVTRLAMGLRLPGPLEWIMNRATRTDAHRAERLEFLENTQALRELLFARAQKRNFTRADGRLSLELKRIWSKQGIEFLAEQQRLTFALWDECAEDEVGGIQREHIEAFVRERCPRGSECEFGSASLEELNRGRRSRVAFAPYD